MNPLNTLTLNTVAAFIADDLSVFPDDELVSILDRLKTHAEIAENDYLRLTSGLGLDDAPPESAIHALARKGRINKAIADINARLSSEARKP